MASPAQHAGTTAQRHTQTLSLRGRLMLSHSFVIFLALALVVLFSAAFLRRYESAAARERIRVVASTLAVAANRLARLNLPNRVVADELVAVFDSQAEALDVRLLIVRPNGLVVYDSAPGRPLEGSALDVYAGVIRATMAAARHHTGVVTHFVDSGSDTDPLAGNTVAIAAGGIADPRAALVIASPPRRFPLLGHVLPRLLLVAGISLAIASVATLALSRRISAPLQRLTEAANAMAAGQLEQAVEGEGPDELGRLVGSFNAMSRQVATAARSQRELLANVAHELRTPLTSVQGYAQALRDEVFASERERAQALAVISREAERMASLIGQLLDLARLESGQATLRFQPVSAAELLRRVSERFTPEATAKGIHLLTSAEPGLVIQGDEDRLLQLASNLVSNAIRHTPSDGTVSLTVTPALALDREARPMVCLTVTDTGEGIPSEMLPRIFDRFVRASDDGRATGRGSPASADRQSRTGFGLGLAIVREIVSLHGGTITVSSQVGEGTTFAVHLPAAVPQNAGRAQRSSGTVVATEASASG